MIPLLPQELDLGPMVPHNLWEVGMGVALLVLLWVVFAKFISPKFEALYAERASQIEGGIMRAEQAQAEAQQAKQAFESQLSVAREEVAKVREDAKNQGALILAQMREQAQSESNRLVDQARTQIEAERQMASKQLRDEVGGLATSLAGRILGESLTDDERAKRSVDRFLAELETAPAQSATE